MGKGSRKFISLMELHNDEVEKNIIKEAESYGFIDIFCCSDDDYHYYEDCAQEYFVLKNIDIVDTFNNNYSLTYRPLNNTQFDQCFNEIYYKVNFDDINKNSTHPLVIQLLNELNILSKTNIFGIYFMFFKDKWSVRDGLNFDIIIAVDNNTLYHRPSRFNMSNINELIAPYYADNLFKKLLFNDIERRPRVYNAFDDVEDLINNFETYSWMVDAITY